MRETALLLAIVLLAGCEAMRNPKPAPPDVAEQARAVMAALADAFNAHDAARVGALFDENAAVVWPLAPGVTTSPEELRSSVGRAFKAAGGAKVTLQSARVRRVGDHRALAVGTWAVSGGKVPRMQLVSTDVLVEREGRWRYLLDVVEPTAAPATGKKAKPAPPPAPSRLSRNQCSALREWCLQACKVALAGDAASPDCNGACSIGETHCTAYGSAALFWVDFL